MEENKKLCNSILSLRYQFNDNYKITYLYPKTYEYARRILSELRKNKVIDSTEHTILLEIIKIYGNNFYEIKYLESKEPRFIAQKFISKKKIREFIFKRDGYKCLKCGSLTKLSIDHIMPISLGGDNTISNLQTLCTSCNSTKKDKFKDYRK